MEKWSAELLLCVAALNAVAFGCLTGVAVKLAIDLSCDRQLKIAKRFRLFAEEKRSIRWRAIQAAERLLSRAADASMCWTGTGAAVFDRRGGSHGLGSRMASGRRRSMSRRSDIA